MDVSDEQRKDRIRHGALEPINLLIQHAHGAAAATLILAGIDVMATWVDDIPVTRPKQTTSRSGLLTTLTWEGRKVILLLTNGGQPDVLCSTRVGVQSPKHKQTGVRHLAWVIAPRSLPGFIAPFPRYPDTVLVGVDSMAEEYAKGVDRFLAKELAGHRQELIRTRLDDLLEDYPAIPVPRNPSPPTPPLA